MELALGEVRKEARLDPNKLNKDGPSLFALFSAQAALLALDRAREDLRLANKSPESPEPLSGPSRLHYSYPDPSSCARVTEPHSVVISEHGTHECSPPERANFFFSDYPIRLLSKREKSL